MIFVTTVIDVSGSVTDVIKAAYLQLINSLDSLAGYLRKFHDMPPGPRLNIKTVLSTYGDFHVKDKTAVRTSYL